MSRYIATVSVIGIMILVMIAYRSTNTSNFLDLEKQKKPYPLTQEQIKWLEEKGEVTVGISDDMAPMINWHSSDMLPTGLLKDYMDLIEDNYNIQFNYQRVSAGEAAVKIKNGEIDTAFCMHQLEYDDFLDFTMPIIKSKGILWVEKSLAINEDSKGKGLKIVVSSGNPSYPILKKSLPEAEFLVEQSIRDAVERLEDGEGNAIAGSEETLYYYLGKDYLTDNLIRVHGYVYEKNVSLAISESNSILFDILNTAIYHMDRDRIIPELQGKWTGISYTLGSENKLEDIGMIILIIFAAVLCVFFIFYQSNKSLYEELQQRMALLIESQNELQTTFDGVTYFLAEINREGIITSINRAFSQFLKMKRPVAEGQALTAVLALSDQAKDTLDQLIEETFKTENEKSEELYIGNKLFEIHTFLIKDNKEKVRKILVMIIDITEARSAERQMLQDNKMIAVGQLAAGVAHEIRNPLGLIRNYCYVLKEIDYESSKEDAIDVIEKQVNKASRIIENLLNFSRISTNKKELVDLDTHINAIIELQKNLISKGREIDIQYDYRGSTSVCIQIEAFEIILINLISNGIDAIAENGSVKVRCEEGDGWVVLSVSDTGSGIPEEIIDDIYNPFFTTKHKREGSGLGLYIVYNEVQKMGGEIKAKSEIGEGTTFFIRIPVDREVEGNEQKGLKNTGR